MRGNIPDNNISNSVFSASAFKSFPENSKNRNTMAKGDIINAIIAEKNNGKTIINVPDKQFSFELPASEVVGEVGEKVSFEVISHTKSALNLKQIKHNQDFTYHLSKQANSLELKELMLKSGYIEKEINPLNYDELADKQEELKAKEREALSQIRRQMSGLVNNTGREAVKALLAAGINLNKIELGMISSMMSEIEKNVNIEVREVSDESQNFEREDLNKDYSQSEREIRYILKETGYLPSKRNVDTLLDVNSKLGVITNMNDNAIFEMLKNDAELSLGNLFKYAVVPGKREMSNNNFKLDISLREEIGKFFDREEIPQNKENLEIAEIFLENEIALTKENIRKYEFLKNIDKIDYRETLKNIVKDMAQGKSPLDLNIYDRKKQDETSKLSRESYDILKYNINIIKAEHIELAVKQNLPLTIKNLSGLASSAVVPVAGEVNAKDLLNAQRQLNEINLKFTYEAANRLYNKNIRVDVVTLTEAVNALRNSENESYATVLKAMKTEDNTENIEKMSKVFDGIRSLRPISDKIYSDIIFRRVNFSIEGISQNNSRSFSGEYVNTIYSKFESSPKLKYGDSIEKISGQYATLLDNLGIEKTNQNIKAAKILTANNMTVNYDNILSVKAIDTKIDDIYNKLHPMIAANMIKEGLNPSEMHIDDVLSYIEKFSEIYGQTTSEKIAEHIHEMDRLGEIAGDDRNSLVSIYRMLNVIQKNGSVALGAAVGAGKPITLGTLMELSENLKKQININIDDELVIKTPAQNNIRAALDKITEKQNDSIYYGKRLIEGLVNNAEPQALYNYMKNNKDPYAAEIETAMELLGEEKETLKEKNHHEKINKTAKELMELQDVPSNLIRDLINNKIPLTVSNVIDYKRTFKDSVKEMGDYAEEVETLIEDTSLDNIRENGYNHYIESIYTAVHNAHDNGCSQADQVMKVLRLKYSIQNGRGGFYLPVKFNGRLTDVDIYVVNENIDLETADDIDLLIVLDTSLGQVRANVNLKGDENNTSITINGNKADSEFKAFLEDTGEENSEKLKPRKNLPNKVWKSVVGILRFAENKEKESINLRQNVFV